jgi:hypothetical protein
MVPRTLSIAALAMIAGFGCNAGTSSNQLRQPAPVNVETLSKTRIIAQINKNARAIKSLEADPAIEWSGEEGSHNLRGRMRMEREKDFRLLLTIVTGKPVADIGSNEKGFWFWVRDPDKKENNLYVCDYDHVGSTRLSVTMQPEWIMEAMGFLEISARDAETIDARPGDLKGQLLLTQFRKGANGATYTKETLVNETTGEIIEHRLYSGAKKDLLARATIKTSKTYALASTTGEGEETKVVLPEHFVLDWVTEKFKLDITMSKPKINPRFSKETIAELFTEPTIAGATRLDLATLGQPAPAPSSFIHETMPRSGIRLGQPQAVPPGEKTSSRSNSRTYASRRVTGLPELPPDSTLIGPSIPLGSATDPAAIQASSRWIGQRPVYED